MFSNRILRLVVRHVAAFLFAALFSCTSRAAAPTLVQSAANFTSGATTLTVTLTSAVAAGNMILVWVGAGSTVTIATPTMTGETFTAVTGASNPGTVGQVACYATNSAVGGQTAVTVTTNAASSIILHVVEISGQSASPQDATGNAEAAVATYSVSTSAATTTANDLVVAFFYDFSTNATWTVGAPYAQVQVTNDATGGESALSESNTVAATGVQTATATNSSAGADTVEMGILAVAGSGAAAPVCTNFITLLGAGCR